VIDRPIIVTSGSDVPEEATKAAAAQLPERVARSAATGIEFPAEAGLGFWTLAHRAELGLTTVPIVVRLRPEMAANSDERIAVMEREALAMADAVLVPTEADAEAAARRFRLETDRIAWSDDLPETRHPRSQAGLATEAMHRFNETTPEGDRSSSVASTFLRVLPEGVVPFLVRVVPRPLKEWFRNRASWPAEAARRQDEQRRRSVDDAIASGAFPELDEPEVTVVIPCYNQGAFLGDALRSVFEQSFESFEVIVVDDGSTDPDTIGVIDAIDLPRTRVIRQDNRGLPAARNAGIAKARGKYIVPLDADDEIGPDFVATLRDAISTDDHAAYAHCWSELFGAQSAVWVTRPWNPYHLLLGNIVVGCLLLRREAWETVGGYDERLVHGNEDWDLWVRLMAAGWTEVHVREPLFRYRQHSISMTAATEARFESARREMAQRHPDLYSEAALRERKARWYPWVSVIVEGPNPVDLAEQGIDDLEILPIGDPSASLLELAGGRGWTLRSPVADVEDGVRHAHGKFVADWAMVEDPSTGLLAAAAEALERAPDRAAAEAAGIPVLWRRWSLVDPSAPPSGAVDLPGSIGGASTLAPGSCPTDAWTAPLVVGGLATIRDIPETEGPFPSWLAV